MLQIILAILAFGVLVVVHEFGHFITAKRGGVQVNEFWIGMGPAIYKKEYHGTLYCLRLLPFGGACVMEGEDGESESEHSFARASLPRRMLIVVAGALMNFLVGFLIVLVLVGTQQGPVGTRTIEGFQEGFRYQGETMLMPGDTILEVNGYHIFVRQDINIALAQTAADGKYDFKVRRDGHTVQLTDVPLTHDFTDENGNKLFGINFALTERTPLVVLDQSARVSVNYARLVWSSLAQLVTGKVGVDQLSGPVGVAEVMANTAKQSMASFFDLVAFISINLGVMNLLPLPALDGGRLLFLVIEGIRRKPVPAKYEGYVHAAGLMLLLALMVYVTGQDILRILMR